MACLEVAPIAETLQGIAFEVNMKKSTGATMEPPVCQRLRTYAKSFDGPSFSNQQGLPTLLQSRPVRTLATEEHATKAKKQNDHQQKVAERVQVEHSKLANDTKQDLEHRMVKASEGRGAMLSARKAIAGRYFEAVQAKANISRQRQAIATAALRLRLEEADMRREATRRDDLAQRSARAGQRNQDVVEKVQRCEMAKQRQTAELRSKLPCEKFAELCLRLHEHHARYKL